MAAAKKNLNPKVAMLLGLGTFFLVSMVLAHLVYLLGLFDWRGAKELAFWIWLGFFVPLTIGDWLWGGKPFKLFILNAVYWLIVLDVAAYILVRWA